MGGDSGPTGAPVLNITRSRLAFRFNSQSQALWQTVRMGSLRKFFTAGGKAKTTSWSSKHLIYLASACLIWAPVGGPVLTVTRSLPSCKIGRVWLVHEKK